MGQDRLRAWIRRHRHSSRIAYLLNHPGFWEAPATTLWRIGTWRIKCWLDRPALVRLELYGGARFVIPPEFGGEPLLRYVFRDRHWELRADYPERRDDPERDLHWLVNALQGGGTAVDVGANLGYWSVAMAQRVGPSGRVLAIEPADRTCRSLRRTVAVNSLSQVRVLQLALSDQEQVMRLYYRTDSTQHSLAVTDAGYEEVLVRTLDSILQEEGVQRVDVIKIDVEGAEELVLRGARETLRRWRPLVMFEVCPNASARHGLPPDGAWGILNDLGYRFAEVSSDGQLRHLDGFATHHPEHPNLPFWNLIAVPPDHALSS